MSDDASVSDTCSRSLQLDGLSVRVAFSPTEGLILAERHRPQVVVVDLRVPAGSALDFVERLRRVPGLAHAPIALLTGDYFISPAQLDRMRALGVTERFRPVWLAELVDVAHALTLATVPA